ncbi:MAG: DUF3098 domain-containing protein [Mucilaginibacter sp.]|uniref:DUF3098 domain-containing protein n=1 Tax=Mucilaginibacter sp. TaxID=1882438 RepID=UPI0034E45C46
MALKHTEKEVKPIPFVFNQSNYRWMLISMAIVVVGFLLMTGDTDIYDFRKIVLAPVVVLAGFGVGFYAILKKPETKA